MMMSFSRGAMIDAGPPGVSSVGVTFTVVAVGTALTGVAKKSMTAFDASEVLT